MKQEKYSDRIKEYGKDILECKEYFQARHQVHHVKTSVAVHSILTAKMGLKICDRLHDRGIDVDERKVVRIALLHDLGMLGRSHRYKNNFECGYLHPLNSVAAAQRIWKDIDPASKNAIRSHMWPLSLYVPTSKEAFVLCLADKMAAVKEAFFIKK